jgi:hypothetical protein
MRQPKLVLALAALAAPALAATGCGQIGSTEANSVEAEVSALTTSLAVNCGGPAVSPYLADTGFKGGSVLRTDKRVDTSQVTNPAPMAVYQAARVGNFTYAFSGFTPGASTTVRLHFAETKWARAGSREFDVAINGVRFLTGFDIVKAAGAPYVAVVEEAHVAASRGGAFSISFTSIRDKSLVSGIEILAGAPNGVSCSTGSQCTSGNCVDGVCCGSAACGPCQACNLANALGVCTLVPAGTPDPSGACVDQGVASCGTNGKCDGVGQCQLYAQGTACSAPSCPTGTSSFTSTGTCTGSGTCQALVTACAPYLCNASNACGFSCSSDAECSPSFHCDLATSSCR